MILLPPIVQMKKPQETSRISVVKKKPLYLLGLHPMTGGWPGGNTIQVAVDMALDHINNNQSILPDYELVHIIADTGVSTRK